MLRDELKCVETLNVCACVCAVWVGGGGWREIATHKARTVPHYFLSALTAVAERCPVGSALNSNFIDAFCCIRLRLSFHWNSAALCNRPSDATFAACVLCPELSVDVHV